MTGSTTSEQTPNMRDVPSTQRRPRYQRRIRTTPTKTTADIEESMLSPEILARVLLLQMHRAKQPNATIKDLLGD